MASSLGENPRLDRRAASSGRDAMVTIRKTASAVACSAQSKVRLAFAGAGLAALASAWTVPAHAAEAAAAEAAAPVVEEVLVTAGKREERLQDVPSAISAMSASQLKVNRVVDVYALVNSTPS